MRWSTRAGLPDGHMRLRRAFLWLPKLINGQWRWLERATWKEKFSHGGIYCEDHWNDICWADLTTRRDT